MGLYGASFECGFLKTLVGSGPSLQVLDCCGRCLGSSWRAFDVLFEEFVAEEAKHRRFFDGHVGHRSTGASTEGCSG